MNFGVISPRLVSLVFHFTATIAVAPTITFCLIFVFDCVQVYVWKITHFSAPSSHLSRARALFLLERVRSSRWLIHCSYRSGCSSFDEESCRAAAAERRRFCFRARIGFRENFISFWRFNERRERRRAEEQCPGEWGEASWWESRQKSRGISFSVNDYCDATRNQVAKARFNLNMREGRPSVRRVRVVRTLDVLVAWYVDDDVYFADKWAKIRDRLMRRERKMRRIKMSKVANMCQLSRDRGE